MEYYPNNIILSKEQINKFGEDKIIKIATKCIKNISNYQNHSLDWAINTTW